MRIYRFFDILSKPIAVLSIIFVVVTVSVFLYFGYYRSKTPTPLPTERTLVGMVLFSDSFDRDANTFVPPWDLARRAATDRLTTDSTVVRKGTHSAKFQVHDSDALAGTTAPGAQLEYQPTFCEGTDLYLGWSWYLPSNFPASMPSGSWIGIGQIGFGPPWDNPPLQFYHGGSSINLMNRQNGQWRTVASIPTQRGQWQDVVAHVKFSKSPSVGFVELWVNGQPVRMSNGSTRQYMNTINQKNASGCGGWKLTLYRSKGYWEWLTLYYDEAKVGTSYAAVAP
jgi:Polysaccharide lyase